MTERYARLAPHNARQAARPLEELESQTGHTDPARDVAPTLDGSQIAD